MVLGKIARIISEIFNGFLTMLLPVSLAIFFSDSDLTKKIIYILVFFLTPIVIYFILRAFGKVSDYEFTKREERPLYFSILSIFFFIFFVFLSKQFGETVFTVSFATFSVALVLTIVNFFWKLSGHMMYGTLLLFTLVYLFPDIVVLKYLFIALPFVGWSRIQLKKHTLMQVLAGTVLSSILCVLIFFIV